MSKGRLTDDSRIILWVQPPVKELPTFPFLGFYSWDVTDRHKMNSFSLSLFHLFLLLICFLFQSSVIHFHSARLLFSVIYWIRNNFPFLCYLLSFHFFLDWSSLVWRNLSCGSTVTACYNVRNAVVIVKEWC